MQVVERRQRAARRVEAPQPRVLEVGSAGRHETVCSLLVPVDEPEAAELPCRGGVLAECRFRDVQPPHLAIVQRDDAHAAGLCLRIADLRPEVTRLGIAGLRDPERDLDPLRFGAAGADGRHHRVTPLMLDGQVRDALVASEIGRLEWIGRLPRILPLIVALALRILAPDVLEQLLLLFDEEPLLTFRRLRIGGRRPGADVRDLAEPRVSQPQLEQVVVAEIVDRAAVPAPYRTGLGLARVRQRPRVERAPVDEPEVAAIRDDAPAVVG